MRLRGSQLGLDRGPKFGGRLAHNGGAEMKAARANKAVTVAAQPPLTVVWWGGGESGPAHSLNAVNADNRR